MKNIRYYIVRITISASCYFTLMSGLIFPGISASAKTILVPSPGITTIQEGVNAATEGDTVLVLRGSYDGGIEVNIRNVTLRAAEPLSVLITGGDPAGIRVSADNVTVAGFQTSGFAIGILVTQSTEARITANFVDQNIFGITLENVAKARVDHNSSGEFNSIDIVADKTTGVEVDHNEAGPGVLTMLIIRSSEFDVSNNFGPGWIDVSDSSGGVVSHNRDISIFVEGTSCRNIFEANFAPTVSTNDTIENLCNSYKHNKADSASPSPELWDVK
jgi:hypothetical protein